MNQAPNITQTKEESSSSIHGAPQSTQATTTQNTIMSTQNSQSRVTSIHANITSQNTPNVTSQKNLSNSGSEYCTHKYYPAHNTSFSWVYLQWLEYESKFHWNVWIKPT